VVAGVGWWTLDQMRGMDGGPWKDLGTLFWFLGVWIVMMAAMMFPSVAPTVALYSRTRTRSPVAPLLFSFGYLVSWAGVGMLAFVVATAGGRVSSDALAWDRAGRWVAGATLIVAAVYELTLLKDLCLGNAAARWASCSAPGVTEGRARCRWASDTVVGASAVVGH
jgi:predicted metal-binding membrane protein